MPDLLAHVLIAYTLFQTASWRYEWITPHYVTVGMAGALIPDMTKVSLLYPEGWLSNLLGIQLSLFSLHTLGGVILSVCIGMLVVTKVERRRVGGLLFIGACSHLVLDALLRKPAGVADPMLYPFTWWRPPTPGLYTSSQQWPTLLALVLAVGVWFVSQYRHRNVGEKATGNLDSPND